MTLNAQETFIAWLDEELSSRNWSDYRLAKEAGLSHSVISKARAGTLPKWDACVAVSEAFGVYPTVVFREAGLLPSILDDEMFAGWTCPEWKFVFGKLSKRDRNLLYRFAQSMKDAPNE